MLSAAATNTCWIVPHFYPHFIQNTKPIRVQKKQNKTKQNKTRVKALLFPFPHQMCSAASAVKWISIDRQMGCSLRSGVAPSRRLLGRTPNRLVLADTGRHPSAGGRMERAEIVLSSQEGTELQSHTALS